MGDLLNGTETELKSWDFRGGYLRLTVVASSTRSRGVEAITNSGDDLNLSKSFFSPPLLFFYLPFSSLLFSSL